MIVRPLNGLMDKGHQGIGDGDPSLAWLTPHQARTPCLPQLGNMPQARCMLRTQQTALKRSVLTAHLAGH